MKTQSRKLQVGFTLIELLVVIAIIGILASIVLVSLTNARKKARDAQRKAQLSDVALALQLYNDDQGSYPSFSANTTSANYSTAGNLDTALTEYLKVLPKDPSDPTHEYEYRSCVGTGADPHAAGTANYELNAKLENTADDADEKDGGNENDPVVVNGVKNAYYEVGSFLTCIDGTDHQ